MRRFIELDTVDSTNSWLAREAGSLVAPVFVRAGEQTAGRGRLDRQWFSGPAQANLVMSALWRFQAPVPAIVPIVAALALRRALPGADRLRIKWPNDIYADGCKLGGILCERIQGDAFSVIIGIGVNANAVDFPPGIKQAATSLRLTSGHEQNVRSLWISVCRSLTRALRRCGAALSAAEVAEFNAHAWRYIMRPGISQTPLVFQSLLPDGRAQCENAVILDMAD